MNRKNKTDLMLKLSRLMHVLGSYVDMLGLVEDQKRSFKHLAKIEIEKIREYTTKIPADPPEPKCIYTITTIDYAGHRKRVPGFFFDFIEAEKIVKENICDIHEELYTYAIIEKALPGLYSFENREEFWYMFDKDKDQYQAIPKPQKFQKMICWSIG